MQNHPPLDFSESQRTYEEACRYIVAGTTQAKMPDLYIEGEYPIHTGTPAHRHTGTPARRQGGRPIWNSSFPRKLTRS